jgi:hypothetical protein
MGERSAEQSHDAVAHDLINSPLVTVHGFHHMFEDWIEESPRVLRITIRQQFH